MKRSTALRDFIIGLAFLGALVVFGFATLHTANFNFLGAKREIVVPFKAVNGIRVGDDVRFYGYPVGMVSEIEPLFLDDKQDYKLNIRCRISEDVKLPSDSKFVVRSAGPLGGRYVAIVPGAAPSVAIETGAFEGTAERDLFEDLRVLIDRIREGEGLLNQIIENEEVGRDFAAVVKEVREIVHSVNEGDGMLGALIKREDLRVRTENILQSLEETFNDIREGDGIVSMLIRDTEARDNVRSLIDNFAEMSTAIRESRGTLGKLINDGKIYEDLEATIAKVREFIDESDEGALAMFARDKEFKNDVKSFMSDLRETVARLNEGEGTIGKLAKSDEVYNQLRRILVRLEDAIEDFREQAPVSTFVNAALAPF